MSANKAFTQFMKKKFNDPNAEPIEHEESCYYHDKDTFTPTNEENCDCYDRAIFRAGYFAAKGKIQ